MAASIIEDGDAMERAVAFLNAEIGDDIKSLSKAKDLYDSINQTKTALESRLSFASTEAPGMIANAVADGEKTTCRIDQFKAEKEELCGDIDNYLVDVTTTVKNLSSLTNQIKELECYSAYLQMIGKIEDFSSDIQSAMLINSAERAVASFSEMAELVKNIQSSKCRNLVKFANDTLMFWYNILRDKYTNEFEEVLTAYRWPFIVSTTKVTPVQNAAEVKVNLDPLFRHLLLLQLPEGLSHEGQQTHPFLANLPGWRPLLLPLQLMVKPLRKRFRFHFYGKKQTNSLDKPEWYLTQVLTWIRDHQEFLRTHIQPMLEKSGLGYVNAIVEFSRGLVVLAVEKMLSDMQEALYDEHIFSHLIDEALAFDRELRIGYGYPASQPGVLHVLTQADPFNKWIQVEKKFALEKMDAMLASETAWQSQYKDITDVDDMKVPECGESFMTLMLTITERYKPLPSTKCKLRFLELQLDMLDDYRIRLLQVKAEEENTNPLGQCFTAIVNTVAYITSVLLEWSELPFFLQLQYQKVQEQQAQLEAARTSSQEGEEGTKLGDTAVGGPRPTGDSQQNILESPPEESLSALEGSVFDEMIQLFEHMRIDMLNNIIHFVFDDVKARSRPYRKEKWLALPSQKDYVSLGLSPSACELLLVLKDRLHLLQLVLSKQLFTTAWQTIAALLDTFIYTEVILTNYFNEGGANQLSFDMTRNLFPLLGQYTQKPENYFKSTKEACIVLTLSKGSGLLIKEILRLALHDNLSDVDVTPQDPIAALQEIGIHKLSPDDSELVLSLRTDLTT